MADSRKKYVVTIGGVDHTILLSSEDAARYGDKAVEVKQAPAPSNKARTAPSK